MNKFLGSGDESKYHLLAGFEVHDDEGAGRRGGSGFVTGLAVEALRAGVSALRASLYSNLLRDAFIRDPSRNVTIIER